jgi:hypothetical protein
VPPFAFDGTCVRPRRRDAVRTPIASPLRDNPGMQNDQAPRAHHDMGGLPASPVAQTEHDYALWEKRVDALMMLLSRRSLLTVDELRRNIEGLGPDAYDRMTYYERWIYAITQALIERGVISVDELGRAIEAVRAREAQRAAAIPHG